VLLGQEAQLVHEELLAAEVIQVHEVPLVQEVQLDLRVRLAQEEQQDRLVAAETKVLLVMLYQDHQDQDQVNNFNNGV
jgi:hypothetical protein